MRWPSLLFLAVVLLASAPAQQEQTPEQPLTTEQRLERLERSLASRALQERPGVSPSSLEARLDRLEARVQRLEQQAMRSGSIGGDRVLEGRVRALEREISRLRR
jgi:TolA-binding protein